MIASWIVKELLSKKFGKILLDCCCRSNIVVFYKKIKHVFEIKAGSVGPSLIFFIPRYKSVSNIHTAFCSYHERTIESGSSLTLHPKASERATATLMAEYASLHCPISMILGKSPIFPRSRSLKRYFPHARVRIIESEGVCFTNSVK